MKRIVVLFGIMFSMLAVQADDNVLQTIEIEPVKDTYNIILVSDKAVDVKKSVQASNKINLSLKDIRASKTLNTVYNNVSNVDTVMVESKGNGIDIYFQAENAEAATITFDSVNIKPVPVKTDSTKNIKLNNPIESYAPIYREDYESTKTSSFFNKLKAKSEMTFRDDRVEESSVGDTLNKIFSFGLIGLLVIAVTRLFRRKEPEMKIGLSQPFSDREAGILGIAQQTLSPVLNQTSPAPFTNVNYGINAYKNETKNPYETTPMHFHNPRLQNIAAMQPAIVPAQRQAVMQTTTVASPKPAVKKMTTPVNTAPVNQSNPNVDNLKFLESMTAIYEKSGRHDLARGLKASLNKNNVV